MHSEESRQYGVDKTDEDQTSLAAFGRCPARWQPHPLSPKAFRGRTRRWAATRLSSFARRLTGRSRCGRCHRRGLMWIGADSGKREEHTHT
ncbi:hypothetical protein HPB50_004712 [Hyalomma asiaticum]|uniref:Uncharacterized protein n=1 Tax=Hyalomma asiaticum TaxID=266040 RepID=A0ACB7SV12_HYAAI|nr:hypothetical protein HPB50_004712 [Hyalomma asiaticum]